MVSRTRTLLGMAAAVTVAGCSPTAKPAGVERKTNDAELSSIQARMEARRKLLAPTRQDQGLTFGRPETAGMRMRKPVATPQAR